MGKYKRSFNPSLCVTHHCNLSCIYCYQNHDTKNRMTFDTAQKCVDWIMNNVPEEDDIVTLSFIGGEPLLRFNLLKDIYNYVESMDVIVPVRYFASTNGTLLNREMKEWFYERRHKFILGLSLDGCRNTHNINRSNSFDMIDIDFFVNTWPEQGVKMTLSENSLSNLSENVISIHDMGFKRIDGVNLAEGDFNWDKDKYIRIIVPELRKLVKYYSENIDIELDQTFGKHIELCSGQKGEKKKWCGVGENMVFFDTDGKRYPCPYITPMTFSKDELNKILATDFSDIDNFVDDKCCNTCYIYPICNTCSGANYFVNKSFKIRNKSKCRINRLIALFVAELHMNRILKHRELYKDENVLYHTIEAIKNIRNMYLPEFEKYL